MSDVETRRAETVDRLRGLTLRSGSHEMLSSICKAIRPDHHGWTEGECRQLVDDLIELIGHQTEQEPEFGVLPNDAEQVCEAYQDAPEIASDSFSGSVDGCVITREFREIASRISHSVGTDMESVACEMERAADIAERNLAYLYMELPTDADGVPIRVGDLMGSVNTPDYGFVTSVGRNSFVIDHRCYGQEPSSYRHRISDSWSRIIMDAIFNYECDDDIEDLVRRCEALAGGR